MNGFLEVHVHVLVDVNLLLALEVGIINVFIPEHNLIPFILTNGEILLPVHCPIVRPRCPFSPWRSCDGLLGYTLGGLAFFLLGGSPALTATNVFITLSSL